ncbi:hypothetical protein U737_07695 [Methylomonas sp. LW13]|uniref:hypothetical protein n=1 Tax=unclassified Methylomonas TaxID=2608980 RepID=UPI00051C4DD6|nr:hypothetical protein [Methylomonas sp. LW13]QBC26792.1 hypothetical protein U737_07695 [Methylomonas sp. LW13]
MSIKTRLSKLEEANTKPEPDKRQAEAIANTKAWLAEILAAAGRPNLKSVTVPYHNPKQWLEDTFRAITKDRL